MSLKLTRIAAGHYKTPDGRFTIRDTYDPSGPAHVREGRSSARWMTIDTTTGKYSRSFTLAAARGKVGFTLLWEAKKAKEASR